MDKLKYIDLFAGAGGMSEGFIRAGFEPVAHVEMNKEACDTLKTRTAFHYLSEQGQTDIYLKYLRGEVSREALWNSVPAQLLSSVINEEISSGTIENIFKQIDRQLDGNTVDVIIGGPPCQAYSLVGRSRDPNRMQGDNRNYLFRYYGQFLQRYKPTYFVFENVLGLLTAGNKTYFNEMIQLFKDLGYYPDCKVLHAKNYGVLQDRKRVIIIGRKGNQKFTFPDLPHASYTGQVKNDILSDLPPLQPGDELHVTPYCKETNDYLRQSHIRNGLDFVTQHITRAHNNNDLEIYALAINDWLDKKRRLKYDELPAKFQSHKNTASFLDRYKVVNHDGCSHTVVAHIAKDGHYYIYPDKEQVRSISVREAARLQSFPDNYFFEGGRTAAFKQIGNAVPPLMAQVIAQKINQL